MIERHTTVLIITRPTAKPANMIENGRDELSTPRAFQWPHGKRIAIYINVQLELWSEGCAPTYSVQTTGVKKGFVDTSGISWSQYGCKVGAWRLIRTLDELKVPATFVTNAKCGELYPAVVKQIISSGHDIAAHGIWQNESLVEMSYEEQAQNIRTCFDMLEHSSGKRPQGWKSTASAITPDAVDILIKQGVLWFADRKDTDLPTRIHTEHGSIVSIPPTEFSDNRTLKGNPLDFYDVYKETFDYLYHHEPGSLMNLTVHCHSGGRPTMVAILRKLYQYFSQFPEVWFTTHGEIARWMNTQGVDEITYPSRFF
jgi:peptidoglycan/xylan/chitin deacetylase (PgdA/CDA1 family)